MSSSQLDVLWRHFAKGGSVTTLEAMSEYGICRLSERVRELEARGWTIDRAWEVTLTGKRALRYWLDRTERAGLGPVPGLPPRGSQTSATAINKTPGGGVPSGRLDRSSIGTDGAIGSIYQV
jgi:hypothetical protein